jgi:two-component system sporulation sensor kinase A
MEVVDGHHLLHYVENSILSQMIDEHPTFGAFAADSDGRIAFANDRFLEQVGMGREELLRSSIQDLFDTEVLDLKKLWKQAEKGLSPPVECFTSSPLPLCRRLSLRFFPIMEEDRMIGLLGLCHEPADSRFLMDPASETAQRIELLFRVLAEHTSDLIAVFNLDCKFVFASPTYFDLLGYSSYEIIGRDVREFVHPQDMPALRQKFKDMIIARKAFDIQFRHTKRHGDDLEVEGNFKPLIDEHGRVELIVCFLRDVNERRRTEELYRQTEKLSLAGQLAAGMAHEIRNPLTAIKGFVQLLEKRDTAEENKRYYHIITSELNRIEVILNELLVLAKPQAVFYDHHSLNAIIHDVVTICESQAILKNVEIRLTPGRMIPWIRCDANQLKQVFINIVKNGIDAMPNGGLLQIEIQKYNDDGVVVHVTDQGSGIPEELLDKLGTPFFTTKEKGTGLGLMVSYKIIEEHRGRIEIRSKVGRGTKVSVFLPLV